jgi:Bacteriophage T4-like portal protein (Gp20)
MANKEKSFYQRLTRLFRSGPAIRRKIKGQDYKNYYDSQVVQNNLGYYGAAGFKREASPFSVMGAYGILDRMSRYAEFAEMENCAEIASALNVYADESCATDEVGQTFHIYSDNSQIQSTLEELFYDVLNIEFNARRMIRNLVKNGDYFMYVEVVPDHGVINIEPLPVNEVEREEGFDKHDPYAVRFRLITRGGKYLENWQMLHFRVLGNDLFLPYGTSLLESARRPWRQLTMMEDSMLVYRLVRSPERRVFYVDVSAIHPNDVPSYMEGVKESMRGTSVIDQQQGRQDFRYNPLAVDEDYFLPTRPNNQTKIESIAGGANTTATEDVEYILKKLIAALMVPKAYLTYDEAISSKATLAQEDIRFSRTVATLQKIVVAELNKLATIHLYALGFAGEDLTNFELRFSNPSTVAVQQKLALISSKIEIAGKAWELSKETGMYSMNYIQRELLSLRPEEINIIRQEARQDQVFMAELKKIAENPPFDNSVDSNIDIFDKENYKVPTSPFAPDKKDVRDIEQQNHEDERDYQARRAKEREENGQSPKNTPISFNPTPNLDKAFRRKSRSKALTGNRALSLPDFKSMLDPNNRYAKDVYGTQDLNKARKFMLEDTNLQKELLGEVAHLVPMRGLTKETQSSLHKMNESLFKKDIELRDVEIISEDTMDDELFVIERELK